jgi:hypothetical protein
MITPWWLQAFIRPTGISRFELIKTFLSACNSTLTALLSPQMPHLLSLTVLFFSLTVPMAYGLIRMLTENQPLLSAKRLWTENLATLAVALGILFCFLIESLLWMKYTGSALAPSRHSLFLLPMVSLGLMFTAINLIKICTRDKPNLQIIFVILFSILSVTYTFISIENLRQVSFKKREAWDITFLKSLKASELPIKLVVTENDSLKTYFMLKNNSLLPRFQVIPINAYEDFPQGEFIFITQFLEPHIELLPPAHKSQYKLIKSISTGFDYEPSPLIKYWPNDFYVWRVSEKDVL